MSVLATFVSADVIGSSGRHWRALRGFKLAMGDRLHGGRTASQPGRQAVGRERERWNQAAAFRATTPRTATSDTQRANDKLHGCNLCGKAHAGDSNWDLHSPGD